MNFGVGKYVALLCFMLLVVQVICSCPSGWSPNGEFCYYLSTQGATFAAAETACESMTAKLTSIHSAEEMAFLQGMQAGRVQLWIGLHDKVEERNFKWIDGTPYDYTNWRPGQPNDAGGNEDCAEIRRDGEWNDLPCSTTIGYVCKKDVTPPVVSSCPDNISTTTELGTSRKSVSWNEPTATDQSQSLQTIRSHAPSTEFPIGTTVVAYIYRDPSGNTATCTFTVTVVTVDTTSPTISGCPSNLYLTTELGTNGTTVSWNEPNATDLSGTPQRSQSHIPSAEFPLGITLVSYLFVDKSNNTATCTFSVDVETVDTTPPLVSHCPTDFDYIGGRHVVWTEPTVFDISRNVTEVKSHSPGVFLTITTRIGYTFKDSSNNIAYCNFTVNVIYDLTPPLIIGCPVDIIEYAEVGESDISVSWNEPSATDEYGRVLLIHFTHSPGEHFAIGSTAVVYTFADDSYNIAQCNFSVIIEQVDTTPPAIQFCPSDIIKAIELGTPGAPVYWNAPTAVDISGTVSLVSQTHVSGDIVSVGRTSVKYTFVDGSANEAYCVFVVTVREVDTIAPTLINCPGDILVPDVTGSRVFVPTWIEPSAVDASGNVTLLAKTHFPGDTFYTGSTNVMYIFADSSKNMAICSFYVHVNSAIDSYIKVDTTAPVIIGCPSNIYVSAELGSSYVMVTWSTPLAIDQYGSAIMMRATHKPGDVFSVGTSTAVLYVFEDDHKNRATCNFSVTVTTVDTTPPSIDYCPDDITETIEMGVTTTNVSWIEPQSSDLSGNVSLSLQSHIPADFSPLRDTPVTYVFVDESGNEAICKFWVSFDIVDSTPPTIIRCPSDIYSSTEVGTLGTVVSWNNPTVMDHSGSVVTWSSHEPGQFFLVGSTNVLYHFEDESLNRAECHFTVHVTTDDTTSPEIVFCPGDITYDIELGDISKRVFWTEPSALDISGNVSLASKSHSSGDYFTVGKTDVNYLFVDGSSNKASCTFHVTLSSVDTTAPKLLNCPSDIIADVQIGSVGTSISWPDPTAVDASGNVTLLAKTHSSGGLFGVGTTTVIYLFLDSSNNIASCNFNIEAKSVDSTPPDIFNCPSSVHSSTELGTPRVAVTWTHPFATDLSGIVNSSSSHMPGDLFPVGSTNVVYQFQDKFLNKAECNFTVTVDSIDTTPPKILFCPSDISEPIELGTMDKRVSWLEPLASDLSGNVPLVSQSHLSGDNFTLGRTEVKYVFIDVPGNKASCIFSVILTFVDTTPPDVLDCPPNTLAVAEVGTLGIAVEWKTPFATDLSGTVTSRSSHVPGDFFPLGSTAVLYHFEDKFINRAECNFEVNVVSVDTTPPQIEFCPDDLSDIIELGTMVKRVSWSEPLATDISGNVTLVSQSHFSGDNFTLGRTEVKYRFMDSSRNGASCIFGVTLTPVDTTPPTILNCPSVIRTSAETDISLKQVFWNNPSASDQSGVIFIGHSSHTSGQFFHIGLTDVSYSFVDNSNNFAFCNFSVIVDQVDTMPPVITRCPSDIYKTIEVGETQVSVSWDEPSAYDKSGQVTLLHYTFKSGEFFSVGSTLVAHTFGDHSNNSATCNFSVTVTQTDTTPPTILFCPDNIQTDIELGSFGSIVNWDQPKAHDASGYVMLLMQSHVPGTFFTVGTTIVTYIFKDKANNMQKCSFSITVAVVETATSVIFNCPSNIQASLDRGKSETTVIWREPFAINLSSVSKISSTHRPNDSFPLGSTPVIYTFEDQNGNQIVCNFTVVVVEMVADPGTSALKDTTIKSTWNGSIRISLAALGLTLFIILIVFCVVLVYIYIRRKKRDEIELEDLRLSALCSHKPVTEL